MRVKVTEEGNCVSFGEFCGLLVDEGDEVSAVVRCDGYGMFLKCLHPSRVTLTTPEEEAYKP